MNRSIAALAFMVLVAPAGAQLVALPVASGFSGAIQYAQDPVAGSTAYVLRQNGQIRRLVNNADVGAFLSIPSGAISTGGERGLLGMAFAPDYGSTGHVYVNFTDAAGNTQISRFTKSGNVLDYASRHDILNVAQPFDIHNGGTLRFGPDGFLYIGMGDGGDGFDPGNRAQTPTTLLGKFLRIDPSSDGFPADPARNYAVPAGNPFFGADPLGALDEIWSFGWRNPFKWAFDDFGPGATGAMLVADVGQGSWEEFDFEPAGAGGRNYGWVPREGAHNTGRGSAAYFPLIDPTFEYSHSVGETIIGGHLYRGSALPVSNQGRYFFADFIRRRLWSLGLTIQPNGEAAAGSLLEHTSELGPLGAIVSIDRGNDGELYVTEYGGRVFKIGAVPEPGTWVGVALIGGWLLRRPKPIPSKRA